jgi:hypothetical protein
MEGLTAWLRQPTSVAGISALLGTVTAMVMHQIGLVQAVPLIAGALVSIVLPDNTRAQREAESLAATIVAGLNQQKESS